MLSSTLLVCICKHLAIRMMELRKESAASWLASFRNFNEQQALQGELLAKMHGSRFPFDSEEFQARLDHAIRRGGINLKSPQLTIMEKHEMLAAKRRSQPPQNDEADNLVTQVRGFQAGLSNKLGASLVVLVVHGDQDHILVPQAGLDLYHRFKEILGEASTSLVSLPGTGHRFHAEEWRDIGSEINRCLTLSEQKSK
eukprot:TRINITY_DN36139_c0_g1_i2.p2 TRINITY_DN36139_c0_g1~~TRINITY_DN36139_c0_g1_i2.p2  ORF type:complete len:198 (-),score=29.70 TRINITY_DN36139_c0_g1_i2:147-740(-)